MVRSVLIRAGLIALMTVASWITYAEGPRRMLVVGQIWAANSTIAAPYDEAFRDGLRRLGYVDGANIKIVARYANGEAVRFPSLLDELAALHADVLIVSPMAVRAAMQATTTAPIICRALDEPVKHGLVRSLSHRGGNVTGLSTQSADTAQKGWSWHESSYQN
jgi:putative tryptophan/tyrosine transport system substrate-binding protein